MPDPHLPSIPFPPHLLPTFSPTFPAPSPQLLAAPAATLGAVGYGARGGSLSPSNPITAELSVDAMSRVINAFVVVGVTVQYLVQVNVATQVMIGELGWRLRLICHLGFYWRSATSLPAFPWPPCISLCFTSSLFLCHSFFVCIILFPFTPPDSFRVRTDCALMPSHLVRAPPALPRCCWR